MFNFKLLVISAEIYHYNNEYDLFIPPFSQISKLYNMTNFSSFHKYEYTHTQGQL